jgi:adenylate cyclase
MTAGTKDISALIERRFSCSCRRHGGRFRNVLPLRTAAATTRRSPRPSALIVSGNEIIIVTLKPRKEAMPAKLKSDPHLEIAHVLFIDVVGYSKLLVNEQRELLQQLNQLVRKTPQFRKSEQNGKLIRIPSGDGMALVFFQTPEEPVQCAMEIARTLKNHPNIRLRMGVHSGPVDQIKDVNDRLNVTGVGINLAQRVMDCGDAGHILISKRVADDLAQDNLWRPLLHDLGEVEVKHGTRLGIVNLYSSGLGNPKIPQQLPQPQIATRLETASQEIGSDVPEKSIAVLAFVNMSNDPENEFFSDGIAEEIINALTKVKALRVAARTSSFAFKGKNEDIGEVGRKLKVNTVLEGSVRKAGNRLRVTAQLINVADGYHLWSERYDRQLEDVFEIQDQIAENIVRALRVVLGEDEKISLEKAPTENLQAYEYYLRGRQLQHQLRRSALQYARRMFDRAIEIDPKFARAHAGIADCCSLLYMYWDASNANLEEADASSTKALHLDPESAEAHTSRAVALTLRRQYDGAHQEFEAALRLNPMLYEAHYFYGRACFTEGKLEEALLHYRDAWRVRPEDYQAIYLSAEVLVKLGRPEEALEAARHGLKLADAHLELNPDDPRAWYLSSAALMRLGKRDEALERARRASAIDPEDPSVLYNVGCTYALAGAAEQAIAHLDRAIQNGFGQRDWVEHDSDWDSIRHEPRFKALMKKL